jgi:hypothetical protein
MLLNSTTIHRFPKNTAFISGERRMVYGAGWDAVKTAAGKTVSGTKSVAKFFNRNPLFRFTFAPAYWAGRGVKWGYKGAQSAAYGAEWAGRTVVEGAKGALDMTGRPLWTLATSAVRDVKMCLWDLPFSILRGVIRLPIALAKSPIELVRGVRDSIVSIPKNARELYQNILQADVRGAVKTLLRTPKDIFVPPIARPLAPVLKPPAEVVSTGVRSKLQYLFAIKKAGGEVVAGAKRIKNAPGAASTQMAAVTAARLEKKKKLEEEKKAEQTEDVKKVRELKVKGGGAKKGGGETAAPTAAAA